MSGSTFIRVRPSPIAGTWYPGNADVLAQMVDAFLDNPSESQVTIPNLPLRGLLTPHAGLRFSGGVAGKAFHYTQGLDVDTVVVISPSHHFFEADLVSTAYTHYETPLGRVPVAVDILDRLAAEIPLGRVSKDPEHAIEIELPFLQRTLDHFELLPLSMLDQSWAYSERLGRVLAGLLKNRKVLWVASSDLSHFYIDETARLLDATILNAIADYHPAEIIEADEQGRGFACGRGAIAAVMVAAQALGATHATIVGYATSGEINQDFSKVVGYGAALFN
ncbi:MAG: AmmeMemoRadiSam system protein B [Chloroflexi bacterium]|nr:AmmeMemoRadiSam system protein B [Chloroflexota bacterium]